MSERPKGASPLESGVVVVAQQLRRALPGGIGTYTRGLLGGIAELDPSERPPLRLFASRPAGRPDPLDEFGLPIATSSLPPIVLDRAFALGFPVVGRTAAVVHAPSLAVPPTKAPLVVALHDIAFRSVPDAYPPHGRRWHERALRRAARRAALFVVPSEATAQAVRGAGVGIGDDRMAIVEYGADHLPEPDALATEGVLRRFGVAGRYLLAVGTLEPRKNLARLFEAFGRARPQFDEAWPLVVVGPIGWGGGSAPPPAGVVFAGEVAPSVLAGLYAGAQLVAYVPYLEGFGLPVVEAMRAGAPVVCSPVPSSSGAGFEVDPTDTDEIADALVTVANDGALRERLKESGRKRSTPLTWEATARGHVAVWRRAAEAQR